MNARPVTAPLLRPPASQRLAAVAALLAPLAMAAIVVAVFIDNFGIALAALALVVVIAVAVWFAVTRRGVVRTLALVVALAAIVGEVVLIATHWHGAVLLVALALLLVCYGAAARAALGRAPGLDAPVTPSHAGGLAAKRPVLIMNPKSGGGKAERFKLADEARRRGVEPIVLKPGDDLLALAEDAVARGADVIGMAGGDGSQALVASVAMRHDVAHVCIPAGTRNHFALDLGLDRDDVVGALDAFTDGVERRIDLARVNDRVFVNNASLGVYASVVQSDAYRDAKLHTWTEMLPDLLGPDAAPQRLRFTGPDGQAYDDVPLVLVSNNQYELTHLAGAGTRPRIDDGLLGVVAARVVDAGDVARLAALETAGQIARFPGLMQWTGATFEVDADGPVPVGLDGEALTLEPPLRFVSLPGALRVRTSRAAGLSPAARAVPLDRASLGMLVRVAVGRPAEAGAGVR
jgi:diacylglycerol kinase family enzyme